VPVLFVLVKLAKMTGNKGPEWFESHLGLFIFFVNP